VNDLRNSKAKELIKELQEYGVECIAHEPYLGKREVREEFGIQNISKKEFEKYRREFKGIILVTAHNEFRNLNIKNMKSLCKDNPIFYDVRTMFDKRSIEKEGFIYKSL
jgi:UDP-N-acetyl-D-galactosamine dehydrogenase